MKENEPYPISSLDWLKFWAANRGLSFTAVTLNAPPPLLDARSPTQNSASSTPNSPTSGICLTISEPNGHPPAQLGVWIPAASSSPSHIPSSSAQSITYCMMRDGDEEIMTSRLPEFATAAEFATGLETLLIQFRQYLGLPILCYALDQKFLPDNLYQKLEASQQEGRLAANEPWLLGLYWVRRFYEQGRGNNYLDVIGQGAFDASQLAQGVFRIWGIANRDFPGVGNNLNLYRFLSECWLLTGDQGETSRLWKALTAIVEEVSETCMAEDVLEAIGRLRDEGFQVPAYLTWRAENGPWLAESIRAIKAGGGDGWLGVIGNNPFWKNYRQRDNATCAWGLRKDGNRIQWAIRIANVRLHENCSITITQSNRNLFECKESDMYWFPNWGRIMIQRIR